MRPLALLWLTAATISTAQVSSSALQIYVNDPLKWERGDRPGQPAPKMAAGQVLVLQPDGLLAIVYGYLYKTPDGGMHILYQEGYSVASGTWQATGGTMRVQYKVIYANVPPLTTKPAIREASWKYVPAKPSGQLARRIIAKANFIPLTNLADVTKLSQVIESHRRRSVP